MPGRLRNLAERMTGDIGILASWRVFERSSPYQIYVEIFADLLGVRITPEKEIKKYYRAGFFQSVQITRSKLAKARRTI